MKIIHISDLHIDAVNSHRNYHKSAALLERISAMEYDHLVVTGDITENADKSSLKLARKLFKKFGLLNSSRTTIIIGNHDIFGGVHLAVDIMSFPKRCRDTNYSRQTELFTSAFEETYAGTVMPNKRNSYPFIKEFDNTVLVGINSIAEYSVFKNPFASNGRVGQAQIDSVQSMFSSGKFNNKRFVVLIHHHFCKKPKTTSTAAPSAWHRIENETMKLRRKKSLFSLFENIGAKLVLHGHLHETEIYERRDLKFLNAGASVMYPKDGTPGFNVIDISPGSLQTKTQRMEPYPSSHTKKSPKPDAMRPAGWLVEHVSLYSAN